MMDKKWIGIQFNFDEEQALKKWMSGYNNLDLETDGEHITINLAIEDLKKSTSEIRESEIVEFIFKVINKFVNKSGYTTCYGHLEESKLDKKLPRIFKDSHEIDVEPSKENKNLIEDFPLLSKDFEISRIIKSNEIYKYLTCVRERCLADKLNLEGLKLLTSIEYMDKEEWEDDINVLRMDIKFEKIENAA